MAVHMEFNITDTGVKQLFSRMSNADFTEMNDEMGQALVAETQERFAKSQAPDGSAWQASQRAIETGGKTGIDSTILLSSITSEASSDGFVIGSSQGYAAAFHFGIDENVSVKAHKRLIKKAFGNPLPFGVYQSVGAHNRNMSSPERNIFGLEQAQQERLEEVWLGWLDEEALQ